jgi:predicted RNA binding protein YcfA (HicA-like mRNA interferase family)
LLAGRIPTEAAIGDVQALFEEAGWTLSRITGSHHQFTKTDKRTEPVSVHHGMVRIGTLRKLAVLLREAEDEEA